MKYVWDGFKYYHPASQEIKVEVEQDDKWTSNGNKT